MRKPLDFDRDRLVALIGNMAQKTKDEISLLKYQLVEVYTRVNMQVSCDFYNINCSDGFVV